MPDPTTPNLNLTLPVFGEQNWNVPTNNNWLLVDTFAGQVVLYAPGLTQQQVVTQRGSTYLSVNRLQLFGTPASIAFGVTAATFSAGLSSPSAGHLTVDSAAPGDALGIIKAATFNATAGGGFQINGAAPAGHALVGNGTLYVDTPLSMISFYQTIQAASVSQPQEPRLNFLADFTVTDNPGNQSTDISLTPTGVTAGSYTNANLTVNAKGQITAALSGSTFATQITQNAPLAGFGRVYGAVYQNNNLGNAARMVTVCGTITGSMVGGTQIAYCDSNNPPTTIVATSSAASLSSPDQTSMSFMVSGSDYYKVTTDDLTLAFWSEWDFG